MIAGTRCEVLVVGQGAAGCMAAATLARRGLDVVQVGRGTTATELSTARIVLPGEREELAGVLRSIGRDHGLYAADAGRVDAITSIGTIISQDLTSMHDWLALPGDRVAVIGLRGNEDLDPDLACRSLSYRLPSLECDPLWADPGLPAAIDTGRGRSLSEGALEAIDSLSDVISELGQETVVLPPLFTGPHYDDALSRLEMVSGRRVREPATPLSNPGRRLQTCLATYAARSGSHILVDREVRGFAFEGRRATSAVVSSGLREQAIAFSAAVLATGGIVGGGLGVSGESVVDPMGTFAVSSAAVGCGTVPPLSGALSSGVSNIGGHTLRLEGDMTENVVVAGSSLPGLSFPLGRGLGHVMASALEAAERAMEVL